METKRLSKLTLNQETVKNLTEKGPVRNALFSHKCPPSVGFPVCTPVRGVN
jgi:hypothetical protein